MNFRWQHSRWWRQFFNPWATAANRQRRRGVRLATIEFLEVRTLLSGTPVISEFLASNSGGLQDTDGDSSDWIEIYNPTDTDINLGGWSLTDNAGDLNEWTFPSITIGANQFLTVFASGKDRTTGPELHTNFKLSADGEYLALVDPSQNVVSEYSPSFPTQVTNVSFGIGFDTDNLIAPGAGAQVLIPTDNSLGNSWTSSAFNPAGWTTGTTGVGYGVVHPGFNVTYAKANVLVNDLGVARDVISDPTKQLFNLQTTAPYINYMGNGGGGNYGSDLAFPNQSIGEDIDDFVIQATGSITIPASGQWTFGVNSDDGFGLQLERNGVVFNTEYFSPRAASDTLATFNIPAAGDWNVSLIMYERSGGASVEMFAAQGAYGSFDSSAFHLLGDDASGGLAAHAPLGSGSSVVLGTDVGVAMQNINPSAYIRVPFNVTDPAAYDSLLLKMRYDDGFVAYLNGVEVARRNAPGLVGYNSTATTDRTLDDATTAEVINLTPFMGLLTAGNNVLAIQGLNSSAGDDSFLILPELTGSAVHPDQLRYFSTPTPGDPNSDPALGVIDRVTANMPAGFYDAPISVTLTTPSAGAYIRYTTDGSLPSATNGTLYTGPINLSSTTTLRAGAFRDDYISLPTITRTYLYLADVIRQSPSDDVPGGDPDVGEAPPGWPTSWGNNVVDYGMDQTIVNQVGADAMKAALLSLPSMSITTDLANLFDPTTGIYANAYNDGRDWEREASVELINPDGSTGFQVNAGLRVRGGYSRSGDNPKHAFRLFFRSEYGDSSLDYPLFGTSGTTSFDKLDVRTAQNYSWSFGGDPSNTMIEDGFERQSQGDMGQPYSRSIWVQLYLDGQYWGIYQIEERPEADFAETYLGGDANNYDVIKPEAGPYTVYATDGNLDAYNSLWQYVTTQDLSDDSVYYHIQGKDASGVNDPSIPNQDVLLDVDNLIVYMIGILHSGNLDAPISAFLGNEGVNNFFAIRDRTGRVGFQFIQHDAEHTLHNIFEDRNGPYPAGQTADRFNPQYLHQQLMANPEYRLKFADAVEKYFFNDGAMTATASLARFQKDVDQLDPAIIAESARWGDAKRPDSPLGKADWLNAVAQMESFLANRNPIVLQQFINVGLLPDIAAPQVLVNGVPQNSGEVIPGSLLRFSAAAGLVYYTTDGSDPRLIGGGINPSALVYDPVATSITLLASGSSWKYFDQGTNLGTAWRDPAYNDSTWASGNAELGYGDGDEATTVGYGNDASNKFITTYFRTTFDVADASSLNGLLLRLKRDDGAVVYINGVEATRSNMPLGTVTSSTLATSAVGGTDEQTFYEIDLNPTLLHTGTNTIAVEIHQSGGTSSDISFDAALISSLQSNPGLVINSSTHILARAYDSVDWSALSEATLSTAAPAAAGNLAVTEINYNPVAMAGATTAPFNDKENFEFIELRNVGTQTIDLSGVRFTVGITFDFSTGDVRFLAPGQHIVVVKNRQAFEARYGTGVLIAGEYGGNLSNGGEEIKLIGATNATIQDFTYDDDPNTTPPWPQLADGGGDSLTVISVTGNYNSPANWRASHLANGTPGYEENDNPATLSLSKTNVNENEPNAVVGALSGTDPNVGDTLTFSLTDDAGGTFAIAGNNLVVANGVLLDFETRNSYSITVRVTDSGGLTLDKTFTITVKNINEAPSDITLSTSDVNENLPLGTAIGDFSTSDPDVPQTPQTFTYSLLAGDTTFFTIDAAGHLKTNAIFDFETKNTYSITVRSRDQGNLTVDKTFTITVNDADDPATNITLSNSSVAENQPAGTAIGAFSSTDQDAGQTFTYTLIGGATDSFTIDGSGNLLTNEVFDFEAQSVYSITVRSTDQNNLTIDKSFTITVTNVNEAPTDIALTSTTVAENLPSGTSIGNFSSTDPDAGNTFTYTLVGGTGSADNGSFNIVNGQLRTASSFDFEATNSYSIRVRSTDQGGLSTEKPFTITVTNSNEAPTDVALANASIAENLPGATVVSNFSTTDPDANNTFTYSLVSGSGSVDNGSFAIVNGQLVTAASFDFETKSSYSVRVRASDQGGLFIEKQFTITVTDANDAPTDISLTASTVAENQPNGTVIGTFNSVDPDTGNTFTYSLVSGLGSTDNASFAINNGQLVTAASFNFETRNSYSVRVRTADQGGLFTEKQFTITVTNVNEAPTDIALSSSTILENAALNTLIGALSSTDPDTGNTFTYSLVSGPGSADNASFTIANGQLFSAAAFDFETRDTYSVRVRSTDQAGLNFEKQFTITILNDNDAPTNILLSNSSIAENQLAGALVGNLSSTDPDVGSTFTYTLVAGAGSTDNARFTISNGQLLSAASFDFEAKNTYTVRIRTTDQGGLFHEQPFTVNVTDANDAPTALSLNGTSIPENQPSGTVAGTFSSTDADAGNTFTYSLVNGAGSTDNDSFSIVNNQLRTSSSFDFETKNSYGIRVRTTDQSGLTFEKAFTITVTNVNEPPTSLSLSGSSVVENQPTGTVIGTFSSIDLDAGNTLTYSLVSGSGADDNASFTIQNGQLITADILNYEAQKTYSIRARATDQGGLSFEKSFTVNVTDANEAPSIDANQQFTIAENSVASTIVGTAAATDPDTTAPFNSRLFSIVSGNTGDTFAIDPTSGQLTVSNSAILDFEANPVFTLVIGLADGGGGTATETPVTIHLTNVNERPSVGNMPTQFIMEDQTTGTLFFRIDDPESSANDLIVQVSSSNQTLVPDGDLVLSGTGEFRGLVVTPVANESGTASITFLVTDGSLAATRIFSVVVQPVNDAPTLTPFNDLTIAEDTPSTPLNLTLGDIDNDVNSLIVTATSSNPAVIANAGLVFDGTGSSRTLVVHPVANQSGSAIITVTVSDGVATSSQEFEVTVTAVDDPPILTLSPQVLDYHVSSKRIVAIDSTATITDADTPNLNFNGAILQVSGQQAKDQLSILKQEGILRKGKTVRFNGVIIGTIVGGKKGTPLTVTLNSAASTASVQALLHQVAFKSTDKVGGDRTLEFKISQIGGALTATATKQVHVGP